MKITGIHTKIIEVETQLQKKNDQKKGEKKTRKTRSMGRMMLITTGGGDHQFLGLKCLKWLAEQEGDERPNCPGVRRKRITKRKKKTVPALPTNT